MAHIPLMISTTGIVFFLSIFVILFFFSLILLARHEKGLFFLGWILIIIFIPIVGSLAYLVYYVSKYGFLQHKEKESLS